MKRTEGLQKGQGKKEDAESGQHCPAGCQGQAPLLLPASGCDQRTSQGKAEGFTARAGGKAHRPGVPVHWPPSVPSRGELPTWGHPGRGAGGAGLAAGQLRAAEGGVGEGEAERPSARSGRVCGLRGCEASTACDRGPGSVVGRDRKSVV